MGQGTHDRHRTLCARYSVLVLTGYGGLPQQESQAHRAEDEQRGGRGGHRGAPPALGPRDEAARPQRLPAESGAQQLRLGAAAVRQRLPALSVEELKEGQEHGTHGDPEEEGGVDTGLLRDNTRAPIKRRKRLEQQRHRKNRHQGENTVLPEQGQNHGTGSQNNIGVGLDPVGHGQQQTSKEEAQGNGNEGSDGRAHGHLPDRVRSQTLIAQHHGMIHERSGHHSARKTDQRRRDSIHEVERDNSGDKESEYHVRRRSREDDRKGDGCEHPRLVGTGDETDEGVEDHGRQNGGHHHEKKAHSH